MTSNLTPHSDAVRRAALPELLFVPDIALALGVKPSAARKAVVRGECGRFLRIGRRLAVRRDSFMDALAEREVAPPKPRPTPPKPSARMLKLLQERKRRKS